VLHGPIWRESRYDVTPHDAVDGTMGRRIRSGASFMGWPNAGKMPAMCSNSSVPNKRMAPAKMPIARAPNAAVNTSRTLRFLHDLLSVITISSLLSWLSWPITARRVHCSSCIGSNVKTMRADCLFE
jgi:hypothetical protein